MLDTRTKFIMEKSDEIWKFMVPILNDPQMQNGGQVDVIFTINARFLNALKDITDENKKSIRKEYLALLDEKFGDDEPEIILIDRKKEIKDLMDL